MLNEELIEVAPDVEPTECDSHPEITVSAPYEVFDLTIDGVVVQITRETAQGLFSELGKALQGMG